MFTAITLTSYPPPTVPYPHDSPYLTPTFTIGIHVCGDHIGTATLNGAIASGKRAAQDILSQRTG